MQTLASTHTDQPVLLASLSNPSHLLLPYFRWIFPPEVGVDSHHGFVIQAKVDLGRTKYGMPKYCTLVIQSIVFFSQVELPFFEA